MRRVGATIRAHVAQYLAAKPSTPPAATDGAIGALWQLRYAVWQVEQRLFAPAVDTLVAIAVPELRLLGAASLRQRWEVPLEQSRRARESFEHVMALVPLDAQPADSAALLTRAATLAAGDTGRMLAVARTAATLGQPLLAKNVLALVPPSQDALVLAADLAESNSSSAKKPVCVEGRSGHRRRRSM